MAGAPPPAPPAGAAPDGKQADAPKPDAFALKLPEGADKRFDPKALEKFKGIMADPKTTAAEKAQALVEMRHAELIAEDKAITEYMEKTRTANLEALKGDPEFGGAKFDRTVANAKSALQQFGGEEVSKLFVKFGIDKDPGLTKMFARIRSAIAEDDTSSRAPRPAPDEPRTPPITQTQKLARRYDKKK